MLFAAIVAVILPEQLWAFDGLRWYSVPASCGVTIALLTAFGIRFGGDFNPALSLAAVLRGAVPLNDAAIYAAAQICGALCGVCAAQEALNLDAVQEPLGTAIGIGTIASEFSAAFIFVSVVLILRRARMGALASGLIAGATFFALSATTPAMSFANPAAAIARTLTSDALSLSLPAAALIAAAQIAGGVVAAFLCLGVSEGLA